MISKTRTGRRKANISKDPTLEVYLLWLSRYLAFSFFPPNKAAAAFLKKLFAGLDKWKSGAV